METYRPYNPDSVVRVEETLPVKNKKIFLRHIPKQGSVVIEGFIECDSLMPAPNQFSCQYALDSLYRDANRVLNFNAAHNGEMLTISYIAVGTVITAEDMNEIKAHMENGAIHGTRDVVLDTVPATQDGGLWYQIENDVPIVYIRYHGQPYRIASKPTASKGVQFAGLNTNYAVVPLEALHGASNFSIEMKVATTDTLSGLRTFIGCDLPYWRFAFGLRNGYLASYRAANYTGVENVTSQDAAGFVADGQIHYVAISSGNEGIKLYCDGALVAQGSQYAVCNSDNNLYIGFGRGSNALVCRFELYEARLWSNTRTPEEIFNGSAFTNISGEETYLRAWYIPDGSDLMTDYSPNGFDAHIYGLTIGG